MAPEAKRVPCLGEEEPRSSWRLARLGNAALTLRYRRVMAAAGCLLGLVSALPNVANGGGSSMRLSPMELISITADEIYTNDPVVADAAAQEVADTGANAIRFFYKVNRGTAWDAYKSTVCTAVNAAIKYNLQPIISFEGVDSRGLGYYPTSRTEVRQFVTTAASVFWDLASSNGCAPDQKRWIFEVNEANNDDFNRYQSANTPAQTIQLDSKISSTLKRDAAKPEINATVAYADSIAEGNHNGPAFLEAQGEALNSQGLKNPYDYIWDHPYSSNPSSSPAATMTRDFTSMKATMSKYFKTSQFGYGEWTINTAPSTKLLGQYSPNSMKIGVSETTRSNYVKTYFTLAEQQGANSVDLFDLNDSGSGSMPSAGELRIDGTQKASYEPDSDLIKNYTGR